MDARDVIPRLGGGVEYQDRSRRRRDASREPAQSRFEESSGVLVRALSPQGFVAPRLPPALPLGSVGGIPLGEDLGADTVCAQPEGVLVVAQKFVEEVRDPLLRKVGKRSRQRGAGALEDFGYRGALPRLSGPSSVAAERRCAVDPPAVEVAAQDRDAVRVAPFNVAKEFARTAEQDARRDVARVPGARESDDMLWGQAVVAPDEAAENGIQRVVGLLHVEEAVVGVLGDFREQALLVHRQVLAGLAVDDPVVAEARARVSGLVHRQDAPAIRGFPVEHLGQVRGQRMRVVGPDRQIANPAARQRLAKAPGVARRVALHSDRRVESGIGRRQTATAKERADELLERAHLAVQVEVERSDRQLAPPERGGQLGARGAGRVLERDVEEPGAFAGPVEALSRRKRCGSAQQAEHVIERHAAQPCLDVGDQIGVAEVNVGRGLKEDLPVADGALLVCFRRAQPLFPPREIDRQSAAARGARDQHPHGHVADR